MKRIFLSLSVVFALACFYFLANKTSDLQLNKEVSDKISGAYEALNFQGARQVYPNSTIPQEALYAAWEKWNRNDLNTQRFTPDPWETLGPHNRGGRTLSIALDPQNQDIIYAGSASGGLWRSETAGVGAEAWEQVETGFPVLAVSDIEIHPTNSNIMYIGTGEVYNFSAAGTGAAYRSTRGSYGMGILKTVDGGETWTKSLDWSYDQQHGIWMIKINPKDPNIVYAATTQGIYKSIDAGDNWEEVLDVVMGTDLLINPDNPDIIVASCGNFGSLRYGIYKSEDAGDSWIKISSDLPNVFFGKIQLGLAPSSPNIIYASIGNGFGFSDGASWLCRSEDFGTTWTVKTSTDYSMWQGWFSHDVAVSPTDPDQVVAIGINVWNSANGGEGLTQITGGGVGFSNPPIEGPDGNSSYVHSDAHDVIFNPNNSNQIYVASDGGIHRSDDGGITWYSANGGYQTAQFYNGTSTSQNDTDFYIGGLQDNGTIRWNGDLTWTRVYGGDGSWTAINPEDDNTFFVSSQNLNVRKTTNSGSTFPGMNWNGSILSPTSFISPYVIAPSNGNVLYAGSSTIAKTIDGGTSWVAVNGGNQLDGNPVLSMEVSPINEDVVYAGTAPYNGQRGHLFTSLDGFTFIDVTGDLPDRYPMDITVDPVDPATAYVVFSGFGSGHVFKTDNYGQTWKDISGNLPDVPTNAVIVDPVFTNHIYVGNDLGVFVSTEGGNVWESYQDGLSTATMVFDLEISNPNRKLRAATHGNGAFERDLLDQPSDITDNKIEAFDFKMYPNPVQDYLNIEFERNSNQILKMDLLDVNGKLIKPLLSEKTSVQSQNLTFDLLDISSGVYFIRLNSNGNQSIKKLIKSE